MKVKEQTTRSRAIAILVEGGMTKAEANSKIDRELNRKIREAFKSRTENVGSVRRAMQNIVWHL